MRKKAFIIIVVAIIVIIGGLIVHKNNNPKEYVEVEDNIEWQAKYIWTEIEETEERSKWVCFRKDFNIENKEDIKDVICRIAADSKYWLYINGEIVVRDGELKRGEKGNSIYYDKLNIDKYLKVGENNISILVWHFGKSSFSHIDSGQGALLFQTQIGDQTIISDDTWKAIQNPAYLQDDEIQNSRLSESNIYYDANLELGSWYTNEYDDSSWNSAVVCGEHDNAKWGELIKRDIPFFKFSDIKEYENEISNNEILEMKLPYNMQLVPYLKIKSEANKKIIISNNKDFNNSELYGKVTYITKDGIQEYESPSWINGDKIYYMIPEGVEVISLGYRQTGYDTEMSGVFESDDEDFNTLWTMANRTLYVNMRDTYMDCPDRERAMWVGDTSIEMEEAMYGLDTSANSLYEKSIKTLIGWRIEDTFYTVSPSVVSYLQLPVQNLLAICSMNEYYKYTGNKAFLEMVYPSVVQYMNLWEVNEDGLVAGRGNYYRNLWQWYDSQGIADELILENAWYYYALKNVYEIADVLGNRVDAIKFKSQLNKMNKTFNKEFWDGKGYKTAEFEGYDVKVNSVAVLSGIADESKYNALSDTIENNFDNSTFMEKYVLEAMSKMGEIEKVQNRIKTRYSEMIESQDYSTTLWEYWKNTSGSKNHAWTGGPIIIMSKYFAGIQPLKPGYSEILIKPDLGKLNKLKSKVNTVKGTIEMQAEKSDDSLILKIDVPEKTLVAIEKMSDECDIVINHKTVYKEGDFKKNKISKFDKEDEKYIYVYLEKGKYTISSK